MQVTNKKMLQVSAILTTEKLQNGEVQKKWQFDCVETNELSDSRCMHGLLIGIVHPDPKNSHSFYFHLFSVFKRVSLPTPETTKIDY